MLIILSSAETIGKTVYARQILRKFIPDFEIAEGYTANFKSHPFKVMDPSGKVVYDTENDINSLLLNEDGSKSDKGHEIFELINAIYIETLLSNVRDNHFGTVFVDIEMDFGVDTNGYDWETKTNEFLHPHTYQDVINNYQNRRFPIHVITGCFSKTFVDLVRADLGTENVKVYNITRHPSVVRLLNEKPQIHYTDNPTLTPELNEKKIVISISNVSSLQRFGDITTLKYEDILESGVLTIEGEQISTPESYINFNGLITTWEKEYIEQVPASDEDVANFNYFCSHFKELAEKEYGVDGAAQFPASVFSQLGYTELTRDQIVAPKE
jgi:hypothetical protein